MLKEFKEFISRGTWTDLGWRSMGVGVPRRRDLVHRHGPGDVARLVYAVTDTSDEKAI